MKKRLLILVATGLWAFAGAQSNQSSTVQVSHKSVATKPVLFTKLVHRLVNDNANLPSKSFTNQVNLVKNNERKATSHNAQASGYVKVGSSFNVNSIRNAECTQVTYNTALGSIFYTHRCDSGKYKKYGTGAYELSYSTDAGVTWDSSFLVYKNVFTRYPNGLVYNPAGNTNVKKAYWAYAGPWLSQATTQDMYENADSIAFGSSRLDSTNMVEGYATNDKPGNIIDLAPDYMSIGDDSVIHCIGNGVTLNAGGTAYSRWWGACLTTGTFNHATQQYDWKHQAIWPHLMPNDNNATEMPYDTIAQYLGEPGTAWSQDGQTGYVVIFGNLDSIDVSSGKNLNFVSYQPIVYITQNGGTTWTMMTPHDFTNDPILTANLHATLDSVNLKKPLWRLFGGAQGDNHSYDLVVDKNNNLHIFGAIQGSGIGNPDSSAYLSYFTYYNFIYDVSTTPSGTWTSRYIDTVDDPADVANVGGQWWSTATSSVAFGARIQASRTTDGSKVFCSWLNDVVSAEDSIEQPDVFGQAMDVTNGNLTPVTQFTATGENFYLMASDYPIVTGSSPATYTIPAVMVIPPATSEDGGEAVEYWYSNAITYTDNDFVGIPTISADNNFSVSPNYPNPFNKLTNFNLNLIKDGMVSVDVFNMVGQKVWSLEPQKMAPGMHVMTINANGFSSGVYFYRVNVGGQSITQKMIVQ